MNYYWYDGACDFLRNDKKIVIETPYGKLNLKSKNIDSVIEKHDYKLFVFLKKYLEQLFSNVYFPTISEQDFMNVDHAEHECGGFSRKTFIDDKISKPYLLRFFKRVTQLEAMKENEIPIIC